MARTALFRAVRRALRESGAGAATRAVSRRSFLAMSAALAACSVRGGRGSIAIVGAGAAGLTAAYRLSAAGRDVVLYEASDRMGGRMFTRPNFNGGQFCELGGELVDSNHEALRALAEELGVGIQRLAPEGQEGEEVYHINGRLYAQSDMLNPTTGRGAFRDLAARIAEDQNALLDADEDWTPRAYELDQMSLRAYLDAQSNRAPAWAMRLLDIAYAGEYGIPTDQQSSLNLVDFIGVETEGGYKMFGDSDEMFRIEGGSSSLTDPLAARLTSVQINRQHVLAGVARAEDGLDLQFQTPVGGVTRRHAHVVMALPFTKLRDVPGIDGLGLDEDKLRAIRELGYGDNAKLMIGTRARPWAQGHPGFPAQTAGVFYSDTFQVLWDTSRGQAGDSGILTNFLTGETDRDAALQRLQAQLPALSSATAESLDPNTVAWMPWARMPMALGSYAGAKVGQYTSLLELTGTPALDGRLHFAGEHTSVDFIGFMNGAVESGERVAQEILAA